MSGRGGSDEISAPHRLSVRRCFNLILLGMVCVAIVSTVFLAPPCDYDKMREMSKGQRPTPTVPGATAGASPADGAAAGGNKNSTGAGILHEERPAAHVLAIHVLDSVVTREVEEKGEEGPAVVENVAVVVEEEAEHNNDEEPHAAEHKKKKGGRKGHHAHGHHDVVEKKRREKNERRKSK